MRNHIILEESFKYDLPKKENIPNNYQYSEEDGFWRNITNSIPLIEDSDGPKPQTKKQDVETGEDRKGD